MRKKICIVTGTRAEYGLLKPVMELINHDAAFELQLIATAMHLSPEFGLTYRQIESDGYQIDRKVEMLLSSDTAAGITKSMGLGLIGFADAFEQLKPDWVMILGDRYEMLIVAQAALIAKIPVIHLHGGEITEGAFDDAIRHAITKLSHLHFTSTEVYRNRVIQLGEHPDRVFCVGALGLENIKSLKLLAKTQVEKKLSITLKPHTFLITYHPETLSNQTAEQQLDELFSALETCPEALFVFTRANSDPMGRIINQRIESFVKTHPDNAYLFDSLGVLLYLSLAQYCTAVVGNSSSGIIEIPGLGIPTINIGTRQNGRIKPTSVIDCECQHNEIEKCLTTVCDPAFRNQLNQISNPYEGNRPSHEIVQIIKKFDSDKIIFKSFFDINHDRY